MDETKFYNLVALWGYLDLRMHGYDDTLEKYKRKVYDGLMRGQKQKLFDDELYEPGDVSHQDLQDTYSIDIVSGHIDYYNLCFHALNFFVHRHLMDDMYKQMKRAEKKIRRKERSKLKTLINKKFNYDITHKIMSYI